MEVDAEVALRPRTLLDQLPCDAPAPATEVENPFIRPLRQLRVDESAARIVEVDGIDGSDKLAHLAWRQRQRLAAAERAERHRSERNAAGGTDAWTGERSR